ncbi:hypothetical protein STTU_4593 [Streptomyces sp. Tu6071]|nr:hypothetical protein STTU_4593 [Streptomyces sp. Tu6071]
MPWWARGRLPCRAGPVPCAKGAVRPLPGPGRRAPLSGGMSRTPA